MKCTKCHVTSSSEQNVQIPAQDIVHICHGYQSNIKKKRLVSCPDQTKRHFFNEVSSGFEISGCSFSSLSAAGLTASVARKRKLAAPIHPSHPLIPHLVQCSSSQGVDVATIYLLEEPEKSRAEQNHWWVNRV